MRKDETETVHGVVPREEYFKAVGAFEHAALKGLYILNGGAALALLAFVGRIWQSNTEPATVVSGIATAMYFLIVGLGFAFTCTVAGFFSQNFFYQFHTWKERGTWGHRARAVAYGAGLVSFVCFLIGTVLALRAFTGS